MSTIGQRYQRLQPPTKKDTTADAASNLLAVIVLFVGFAFLDAWLFMLLVDGLNAVWFPRLPVLGYWQAFGIIVPLQWLVRRGKVRSK